MSPTATATERAPTKGEETRAQILAAAVRQASRVGFESLTIGALAEATGLSKSGLFAHFGSKLDLQIAALDEAARQFTQSVFLPAMKAPRGLKRLRTLMELWLKWPSGTDMPGGCPIDAALREYDHQPGPMRDAVLERQRMLERELQKAVALAVETGELHKSTDTELFAFEIMGVVLAYYRGQQVVGAAAAAKRARAAFDRLIQSHSA